MFSSKPKFFQLFDIVLLFSVFSLITLGVLFIYSAGINSDGINVSNEYIKQIIWAGVGLVLMVSMTLFDYRKLEKHAVKLFIFLVVVLVLTRLVAKKVNGARSWLGIGSFGVQPSEFCKIIYIIFLGWYFDISKNFNDRTRFILALLIFMVPFGLIMAQPDLGTASVYVFILLLMMLFAGIKLRYIMILLFGGMLTVYFTVLPAWQEEIVRKNIPAISLLTNLKLRGIIVLSTGAVSVIGLIGKLFYRDNKYFYWISYIFGILCASLVLSYGVEKALATYQIKRLIIFINPEIDVRGSGWQIIQSMTAVGSGGIFGEGFTRGNLCHLRYLPQQSTDFIFGILSEESGFIGGMVVFALYFLIMMRALFIIKNSLNSFGLYISAGILGIFMWHFIVNVGMVIGSMPITGIPLMFISYGGSSLWTAMTGIGLLMSVRYRKYDFN